MSVPSSFDKNIHAIYFVANSASSFFTMMRDNYFVQNNLAILPAQDLIAEFLLRATNSAPKSNSDIAELYAILIALTFKKHSEVGTFFKDVAKVKHDWFAKIAQIYLMEIENEPEYLSVNITDEPQNILSDEDTNIVSTDNVQFISQ